MHAEMEVINSYFIILACIYRNPDLWSQKLCNSLLYVILVYMYIHQVFFFI